MSELYTTQNNSFNALTSMMSVEAQREIGEIQAKIFLARQFPRDETQCLNKIIQSCKDSKLAEVAQYSFPRGNQEVKGASIRLLEVIGQNWGNLLTGIKEINRTETGATMKSYAWDLETNVMDEKVFDVSFRRDTKAGGYLVNDERDKYEISASSGARRKRACMQAVIPAHVIEAACKECENTLKSNITSGKSIEETRKGCLEAFQTLINWISPEMLSEYVGKEFDKIGEQDILKLKKLYNAVRDGFAKPEEIFKKDNIPPTEEDKAAENLTKRVREK